MRLIIDTDAGVDDAQAIMMALAHPAVTVEAITTVTGNVHIDKVIPNVFTILHFMKKRVPVYRGADRPILYDWDSAEHVHGGDGLGDWAERPSVEIALESEPAAQALVRLANQYPGELTLVALGPLTNIALACHLDPAFPSKIARFVFMGGAYNACGNVAQSVAAEFNIYVDPEAAFMTLRAFPRSTMVSWEATMDHPMAWPRYSSLRDSPTDAGRFMRAITDLLMKRVAGIPWPFDGYLLPDPLAMAVALEPGLVIASELRHVTVETAGRTTRGQTVVDRLIFEPQPPNVEIVTRVDSEGFFSLMRQAVS